MSKLPLYIRRTRGLRAAFGIALPGMVLSACVSAHSPPPNLFKPPEAGSSRSGYTRCVRRVIMSLPEGRPLTRSSGFEIAEVKRIPSLSEQPFREHVELVRLLCQAQKHEEKPSRLAHFEKIRSNAAFVCHCDNEASFWVPILERHVYLDCDHACEMRTGGAARQSGLHPGVVPLHWRVGALPDGQNMQAVNSLISSQPSTCSNTPFQRPL